MKETTYNIVIIGAGQLGGRHLEGLLKSRFSLRVYIIDNSRKSLNRLIKTFKKTYYNETKSLTFHLDMNELPELVDVAIISTTADVRKQIIEQLISKLKIKNLVLEKILFQKKDDLPSIQGLLTKNNIDCWVNCPRRTFKIYKKLKSELGGQKIQMNFQGRDWGLACNAVHFIDLLVFFTGEDDLIFNNTGLHNRLYKSKRNRFKELKGSLTIQTKTGSRLVLIDDYKSSYKKELTISVQNKIYQIYESENYMDVVKSNILQKKEKFKIPFQSQMTGDIVDEIILNKKSELVSYSKCVKYNYLMLESLLGHFSKINKDFKEICPIT